MGDSEDSRDTRGRKAWAEGRASSELGDLSSPSVMRRTAGQVGEAAKLERAVCGGF